MYELGLQRRNIPQDFVYTKLFKMLFYKHTKLYFLYSTNIAWRFFLVRESCELQTLLWETPHKMTNKLVKGSKIFHQQNDSDKSQKDLYCYKQILLESGKTSWNSLSVKFSNSIVTVNLSKLT